MDTGHLVDQMPFVAVLAVFAWFLLKLVGEELKHYREAFDGVLRDVLAELRGVREVTEKCQK